MRGLAEFIMRGRWQALAVAILGAGSLLFGWISAAAVALVTLRKGASAGGWLVLWALLPAIVAAWFSGDSGSVLLLGGTFALALVLRATVSLSLAIAASVVVGFASGGSLLLLSDAFLEQLVQVFGAVLEQLEAGLQAENGAVVALGRPTPVQVAGILAAGNAMTAVLSLLLARYWQAVLYNPGGFQQEFHSLRLPVPWTIALAVLAVLLWLQAPGYSGWAVVAAVPLMFCGFALVHHRAAHKGRGTGWLTAFYVLWFIFDPIKVLILALVVIDGVMDFRSRWTASGDDNDA